MTDAKATLAKYLGEVRRRSPSQEIGEINPERLELIFRVLANFQIEPGKSEEIGVAIETALARWEFSKKERNAND